MHQEEQPLAKCEEDFTLKAAIDVAALLVKKGPVALCSYIYLLLQENKRLKAQIKLLEKDLKAAQDIFSQNHHIHCNFNDVYLRKRFHPVPSSENEYLCTKNVHRQRSFRKDVHQQAVPEFNKKLSRMENSLGADSGIQLSLSQSLGDLLLPQLTSSEDCAEFRRSSGRFSDRSLNSFRSSLLRRNSKSAKLGAVSTRNSLRAVQLKSICKRTSLDYSSEDAIPRTNSQTKCLARDISTIKPSSREACISEEATANVSQAPAGETLCSMTVVAQVHRSASEKEVTESQADVEEEESSIQSELSSEQELDLESACPLFGCLCKACSELQLLDPGFMYYIDECEEGPLTVGTELLVSKEGDDQQTVTVSVLYFGHSPQTSVPSDYSKAEPPDTFPVGVVALFPDGRENFVPLSNILYVVDENLEQSKQHTKGHHIVEDQVMNSRETELGLYDSNLVQEELQPLDCDEVVTSFQDSKELMAQQANCIDVALGKCWKSHHHGFEDVQQCEIYLKSASVCRTKDLSSCDQETPTESDLTTSSSPLQGCTNSEESFANKVWLEKLRGHLNTEELAIDKANFCQTVKFDLQLSSSNCQADKIDPVDPDSFVNDSQIADHNSVMEAINPAFELSEQCSSSEASATERHFSSSGVCVLASDHPCSTNANHMDKAVANDAKFNHSSQKCKGFHRCNDEGSIGSQSSTDLTGTLGSHASKNESMRTPHNSCSSTHDNKCPCYNSCKNYDNLNVSTHCKSCKNYENINIFSAQESNISLNELECFGSDKHENKMSSKDLSVSVSLAGCRSIVGSSSQDTNDSCRCCDNDCFEADSVAAPQGFPVPDLGKSLSFQSSANLLKDSFFPKSSCDIRTDSSKQISMSEKIYSTSVPLSNMGFQKSTNFNNTPLNIHVRCFSDTLAAEDSDERSSISRSRFGSWKSYALPNSTINPRQQMSRDNKVCSLSDRDVRISIRSTSPESVSKAPKGDIFNRALKLFRRRSSSVAESINLEDVSHV